MSTQQTTLHDFTLDLLSDPTALLAFQQDPEGVLSDAGLGGITAGDVYEILPLVLDSASIVKVDAVDKVLVEAGDITGAEHLKLVTENLAIVNTVVDGSAPSAITALVGDFSSVNDVCNTIDAAVLNGTDIVGNVSDNAVITKVTDNEVVTKVTDVADLNVADLRDVVTDVNVSDVVAKTAVLNDVDVLTGDVENTVKVTEVVNIGDTVVQDVAQIGDITVKDVANDLLAGGIGNGNDLDIHF